MYSPDRLPIYSATQRPETPGHPHGRARYYAHRVKESLATRISKVVCSVFLTFLFILGILTFILWLNLRPHRPRFHIYNFSVPSLSQAGGIENAEIAFNFTIRNANQHIGIYYYAMEGSVFYKDQKIGSKPLLFPFYQQSKNTTIVTDVLSGATLTVTSQRWAEFMNDRAQGRVTFRLDVTSDIRFKVSTWSSKHHRMHGNCEVSVGADGSILPAWVGKRCPVYFT